MLIQIVTQSNISSFTNINIARVFYEEKSQIPRILSEIYAEYNNVNLNFK